jgi:glycine cleavage system transcriptional repressor
VPALAVTVVGQDRPGIIARAADILAGCAMNLEDSSMTLLRGQFAMTLICSGDTSAVEVESALAPLGDLSLSVTVRTVPDQPTAEPSGPGQPYLITVHGADRLGIVARLAAVIAEAGGNITDLTTRLTGGLYVLAAEVDLPSGSDPVATQSALTAEAADLGVDISVRPLEDDEL